MPENALQQILYDTLGPSRQADASFDDWIKHFDDELVALRSENKALKTRIVELERAAKPSTRPRSDARKREIGELSQALLPDVRLLRHSLEVIVQELSSFGPVLHELRRLSTTPGEIKAKRVQRAPDWMETRFNTGQKDDGRLYFKHADGTWMVLVSFKDSQERDIEYLTKH